MARRSNRIICVAALGCWLMVYMIWSAFDHQSIAQKSDISSRSLEIKGWYFPDRMNSEMKGLPSYLSFSNISSTLEAAQIASYRQRFITKTRIPAMIHQTWKSHNVSQEKYVQNSVNSWKSSNPDFVHLLWDDSDIDDLVKHFYPSWYAQFKRLPKIIHQADLLRYLVLNAFGGVYADVDTLCLRPINQWVGSEDLQDWHYNGTTIKASSDVAFIAGVEADVGFSFGDKWKGIYNTPLQMCQWSFASLPGHPVLAKVLTTIFKTISEHTNAQLKNMDVIQLTGPAPWTQSLFWTWKAQGIDWNLLREFGDTSRMIGDQLIFPITAFSPGLGQVLVTMFGSMGSKVIEDKDARVRHMWAGSWRE